MSSQSTPGAATEKQVATAPQSAMESLGGGGGCSYRATHSCRDEKTK